MGRRKRCRDSDVELTVEEIYDSRRRLRERSSSSGSVDEEKSEGKDTAAEAKKGEFSSDHKAKKQKVESEDDKIDAFRRKKQERKQRKKEKQAEKAKQAEELRESRKKLSQQKEAERKEKTTNKSDNGNQSFITVQKGVQYQDVLVGKGPEVQDRKKVRVAYTLRAKHRFGKILDTSNDFGFRLGRGEVIDGWDLGVQGMRQGGKRYLIVPPQAGYGNQNIGGGPGATLFFEVTVLKC